MLLEYLFSVSCLSTFTSTIFSYGPFASLLVFLLLLMCLLLGAWCSCPLLVARCNRICLVIVPVPKLFRLWA